MNGVKASRILSLVSCAGVGLTAYFSARGARKAMEKPDKKQKALCYIPAAASGLVTCGCILSGHHVARKEVAALTATCGYLAANRDKLEEKVRETLGDGAEAVISDAKPRYTGQTIEETGKGDEIFLEGYSGRIFRSSIDAVFYAEEEMNRRHQAGEYVSMNDFYELLGIQITHFGNEFGWPPEDTGWCEKDISFENGYVAPSDERYDWIIETWTYPTEAYMEVQRGYLTSSSRRGKTASVGCSTRRFSSSSPTAPGGFSMKLNGTAKDIPFDPKRPDAFRSLFMPRKEV